MVWFPADKALMFASGISAYPASDAPFQIPSPGMNGKPVPVAPTVSMKPSAALTVEPELVMLAVTRTTGWLELRAPAPLFGLGVALTAEVTGPPATTLSAIVAKAPQLPNASRLRTLTAPPTHGLAGVHEMVASRPATGAATLTVIAVPRVAAGGVVPRKYSAAVMFDPPLALSLPVACSATLTVPLLGLGVRVRPLVSGPALSRFRTAELNAPHLSFASFPCT